MGWNKWERIKRKRKRERFPERREEDPSLRKQNFLKNGNKQEGKRKRRRKRERFLEIFLKKKNFLINGME